MPTAKNLFHFNGRAEVPITTIHLPVTHLFTLSLHCQSFGTGRPLAVSIYLYTIYIYTHTYIYIYIYKIRFILSTLLWFCVIIPFGCSCCLITSPSSPAYLSLPQQTLAFLTLRYFTLHYITLRSIMRLSSELINSFYNENYIIAVMVIVYDHHYRPYHGQISMPFHCKLSRIRTMYTFL